MLLKAVLRHAKTSATSRAWEVLYISLIEEKYTGLVFRLLLLNHCSLSDLMIASTSLRHEEILSKSNYT
jgi:hypothetical protein